MWEWGEGGVGEVEVGRVIAREVCGRVIAVSPGAIGTVYV